MGGFAEGFGSFISAENRAAERKREENEKEKRIPISAKNQAVCLWITWDLLRKIRGHDMEGEALRAGKERVRENLILPLTKGGMIRKRGMPKAAEDEMLANLEARLAYMTADNLKALAEVLERYAGGKHKNVWPAEVSIYNWARAIQFPPASESRLVRSYLQSAAGSAAEVGGYLVELFWYLKKFGAPPEQLLPV